VADVSLDEALLALSRFSTLRYLAYCDQNFQNFLRVSNPLLAATIVAILTILSHQELHGLVIFSRVLESKCPELCDEFYEMRSVFLLRFLNFISVEFSARYG
jgi:hypothetical protein